MVEEHWDFIWRLLRRLGVRSDSIDDAAQEVFMVAMRRVEEIQHGAERSFLFGTALRVASDRRRAAARHPPVDDPDLDNLASAGADPERELDDARARALLDRVLDELEDELRSVFVLFELDGMTMREIADLHGIPAGTAASRLRRAREQFEAAVRRLRARSQRGDA